MNILLLAGNSFISRSIFPFLSKAWNIDVFSKSELDLTDLDQLKQKLNKKYYDFVINPAISGSGRLLVEDSYEDFYKNLLMVENLLYLKDLYGKLIHFSSGAANNRQNDLINIEEGDITQPPTSRYSLAKYLLDRRMEGLSKVINLRIFNIFGPLEKENRFIKANIKKYIEKQDIEIWGDKYFDFFYYEDLITVLEYYFLNTPEKYEELNLTYKDKLTLFEISSIINCLSEHRVNIIIKDGINKHYTGKGLKLENLKLNLIGLKGGIKKTYIKLNE